MLRNGNPDKRETDLTGWFRSDCQAIRRSAQSG
jgi:hypothetical protein